MPAILRRARCVPLALAAFLLTACTGFNPGQPNAGAAQSTSDRATQYASDPANGKTIGAVIIAIAGVVFLRWLWSVVAIRILLALVVGGAVVYLGMKGAGA